MKKKFKKNVICLTLICIMSLSLFSVCNADGVIIPVLPPHYHEKLYPLNIKYHRVKVEIDNQVAVTKVDEVFENKNNIEIEGIYIFPIPVDASISSFSMFIDGKKQEAQLLDKDKARNIYEDIVRKMKDPALLEYADRGIIKLRVYPIPANGEKRVQLEYSQILKMDNNLCRYVYPLNTEKFSADEIKEVTITAKIKSDSELRNIYSPTHEVAVKRQNKNTAKISYEENNIKPDKDFILYYSISNKDIGMNLLTYKEKDEDGFFILMVSPKYETKDEDIIPKEIIFILDTSGSMSGEKIKQAKGTLTYCVENLNPEDKFNIIDFNSDINYFDDEIVAATEKNKNKAKKYIKKLKAAGGTDINGALISGLKMLKKSSSPKFIIFLTDGLPTIGETNVAKIIENVNKYNKNLRIFTFGVGYDVNTILLDKISSDNKGISEYVKPEEDIEVKVSSFYDKIKNPVLANLELKIDGVKTKQIYPKSLSDIFKGSQLIILGKYSGSGKGQISLTGEVKKEKKVFKYNGVFPEEDETSEFIPILWASVKIGFLLEEIRIKGENKELIDEIIDLSKKYGIITPYTSFLVTEDKKLSADEERDIVSTKLPSAPSGEGAVRSSVYSGGMKKKTSISKPGFESEEIKDKLWKVKNVGNKTFYFRDEIWTESTYNNQKTNDIKFASEDYFRLTQSSPELGKYLSLGEKVIFEFKGKWYKIE